MKLSSVLKIILFGGTIVEKYLYSLLFVPMNIDETSQMGWCNLHKCLLKKTYTCILIDLLDIDIRTLISSFVFFRSVKSATS